MWVLSCRARVKRRRDKRKKNRRRRGKREERRVLKARRAETEASRLGQVGEEGSRKRVRTRGVGGGSGREWGVKGGYVDQYGVYLPLVYGTVWIHQRRSEQEKKQGIGWEGGITDNILFNYSLNKNIVFLKERNQLSQTRQERKEKKSKCLICKQNRKQRKERKIKGNPVKEM